VNDEVTITLRKDELQSVIVALTQHFDRTSGTFEEIAARFPILANGYDRLCHQAQKAGVPMRLCILGVCAALSDKSVDGGAA
jgi:hypothetical protein